MACTACLVCLVSTVSGHCKNTLGRASTSSGHITKLEQSTFLRYLWRLYTDYIQIQRVIKNDNRHSKVKKNTPLLAVRPKGPQITFFSQCKNALMCSNNFFNFIFN